jgi:hypothetical protein
MPRTRSTVVVASPAAAAETAVCTISQLVLPSNDPVDLEGMVDLTIGTAGVSVTLKIERGAAAGGTVVATGGPYTAVAGNRMNLSINGSDLQVPEISGIGYVLTVTVGSASAVSTVNNTWLGALY